MTSAPSRDVDELYAVPPAEFTRRRNEVAARLLKSGQREEAAGVRRLKRPSPPVWVINVLAREQPKSVKAFVDATDRLRRAQADHPGTLQDASHAQRQALHALTPSMEQIFRRGGLGATAQTRERISRTLLGAAADRDTRQDLLLGRLTEERQAPGFDALLGARIAALPARRTDRSRQLNRSPGETQGGQRALEARLAAEARAVELARKARALKETADVQAREAAEATEIVARLQQQLREAAARARERAHAARKAAAAAKRAQHDAARLRSKQRD